MSEFEIRQALEKAGTEQRAASAKQAAEIFYQAVSGLHEKHEHFRLRPQPDFLQNVYDPSFLAACQGVLDQGQFIGQCGQLIVDIDRWKFEEGTPIDYHHPYPIYSTIEWHHDPTITTFYHPIQWLRELIRYVNTLEKGVKGVNEGYIVPLIVREIERTYRFGIITFPIVHGHGVVERVTLRESPEIQVVSQDDPSFPFSDRLERFPTFVNRINKETLLFPSPQIPPEKPGWNPFSSVGSRRILVHDDCGGDDSFAHVTIRQGGSHGHRNVILYCEGCHFRHTAILSRRQGNHTYEDLRNALQDPLRNL